MRAFSFCKGKSSTLQSSSWVVVLLLICGCWKAVSSFNLQPSPARTILRLSPLRATTTLDEDDIKRFIEQKEREEAISACPLFRDMPIGDFARLVAVMKPVENLPLDEPFLKEGDPGDTMYIVAEGSFECYSGDQIYKVCRKHEYFGELSLLYKTPRAASVRPVSSDDEEGTTNNKLWEIRAADFEVAAKSRRTMMEEIAKQSGYDNAIEDMEKVEILKRVEWFKKIRPDDLEKITRNMKSVQVKKGKDIIKQGDEGNSMFIVARGSFECYDEKTGNVVAVCEESDYFGELALLFRRPRAVSVRAASDGISSLWELNEEGFLASIEGEEEFETVMDAINKRYLM